MPSQKHTLLFVPNYDQSNPSSGTTSAPLSYLRLGSVESSSDVLTSDALRGDDLLDLVGLTEGQDDFFEDDHRASQDGTGSLPSEANALDSGTTIQNAGTLYHRYVSDATTGTQKTRAELTTELRGDGSAVLARGGWRDHTDGNRIVTVRGDRVDVVMGNYMRVILGRVAESSVFGASDADPLQQSSWEVSGGHIFEKTSTGVAALKSIEWVKESSDVDDDQRARWKVLEKTQKGDTVTRYSGRIEEYFNGPWMETRIGKDEENDQSNPEIIDECWVEDHDAEVEADEVVEETTVDKQVEIDDSRDATLDTKVIAPIYDITTGQVSQYIDTFNEELWTVDQDNLELYGFALGFEAAGQKYGGAGYAVSMSFGTSWSFSFGVDISMYMGWKLGVRFGPSWTTDIAGSLEINCGLTQTFKMLEDKLRLDEEETDVNGYEQKVSDVNITGVKRALLGFRNKT